MTIASSWSVLNVVLPYVSTEDCLELLVVKAVYDGVNAGVEVPDPKDVQVQAVRRLNLLDKSSLLNLHVNKKSNFVKQKYVSQLNPHWLTQVLP